MRHLLSISTTINTANKLTYKLIRVIARLIIRTSTLPTRPCGPRGLHLGCGRNIVLTAHDREDMLGHIRSRVIQEGHEGNLSPVWPKSTTLLDMACSHGLGSITRAIR